jgi:glycogen operon protein
VPGLRSGQVYGYRAQGPWAPERGLRFDARKLLLDPYGLSVVVPGNYDRFAAGDTTATAMRSMVVDPDAYDWGADRPLQRRFRETVIYEMHLRGFTRHSSSGVAVHRRGTYAGLVDKIPYLTDLGVTAIELLPVFQFDAQTAPPGLVNYWGYQPVSFFAPHAAYSSAAGALAALDEFRDMVKAFHAAGLEVILDVVFNHTAEGGADGPSFCFRGLANDTYYILGPEASQYADYTGCGNTLNANQPIVRRLIRDSLRYWVTKMHVDGFRFDLASILSRDEAGQPLANPPILWDIESDPILAGTKLIAEAWDAAGLYQVGQFAGDAWQEWNGRFRDDIRRFVKSDRGCVRAVATRLLGSPDLYAHKRREPEHSINFVTCHDGFTLNDLVSYDTKHNDINGESGRDGASENLSWNCGVEGPTDDPAVEALRNRQVKNFLTLNLIAAGTPMVLMGDEVRRTQRGNNNAYCQDNEIGWFDWALLDRHRDVHRFARALIHFRQHRDLVAESSTLSLDELLRSMPITWHGVRLDQPDWDDDSHAIAFTVMALGARRHYHVMLNAFWEPLTFEIPGAKDGRPAWRRWIDTALASPDDVCALDAGVVLEAPFYDVQPRSIAVLTASMAADGGHREGRNTHESRTAR